MGIVADGKGKRWLVAAQHAGRGGQTVPVGLGAVQHQLTARLGVAGKIGRFLHHEAGEVGVPEVHRAGGVIGQLAGEIAGSVEGAVAPEHDAQGAGHACHALPLDRGAGLVDALRGLDIHIHAVQRVEVVGRVVVPAQMQDGTGVCDQANIRLLPDSCFLIIKNKMKMKKSNPIIPVS